MSPQPFHPTGSFARHPLSTGAKLLLLSAALMACTVAFSAAKKSGQAAGKKAASKVTFIDSSSSETPEARVKRLKIECKGRPNAGACLGHTR